MIQAAALSASRGVCGAAELGRIEALVRRAGPALADPGRHRPGGPWSRAWALDKKSHAGKIKFVLCEGIGGTRFQWFSAAEIVRELASRPRNH